MLKDLFLLRPDVAFLNHGSFGASPRVVFEAYQAWQLELERQPVEFLGRRFRDLLRAAREPLAAYAGAQPEDMVYVANATTGINIVARSLPLEPGDEVLTTDHEYGAVDRTWRFVCQQRGARYTVHHDPETLWSAVTPRTKVIAMSHITSPTAIRLPVEDVVAKAREAGILTVIDGAHTPGQIPLGLDVLGADFYAGNCHKWMCAPKGAGFLHARKDRQHLLQPLVVSWGWKAEDDWLGETPFITLHEWQGTHDISPWLSVPVAIDFMREHDWPAVQRECYELVRYAIERVGLPTMEPHAPNMAAFRLPPCNAAAVKRRLYDDYLVEVPVFVWRDQPLLRVSIQAYNTREDVDRLAEALSTILTSL